MLEEHVYRYPRYRTWILELVSGLTVMWSLVGVIRVLLRLLWSRWPLDPFVLHHVPLIPELAAWIDRTGPNAVSLRTLLAPLLWLFFVLLGALLLHNVFPAVRLSVRGILVRFANDWIPIPWEGVRAVRITDNARSTRFVVHLQIEPQYLTAWHRAYSFLYRLSLRRGFLITSSMTNSEGLLRDMLHEIGRRRKLGEKLNIQIKENARSPLFSLLLNPVSLFRSPQVATNQPVFQPIATAATLGNTAALAMPSMGGRAAVAQPPTPNAASNAPISASYPHMVAVVLKVATVLIGGFAVWRYFDAWRIFLRYIFPRLQSVALFDVQVSIVSPWGLLIGAHLGLLLLGALLLLVHHLFPTVVADQEGLILTALNRSYRLSWDNIRTVKATSLRDEQHVVLVEAEGTALPWFFRMGAWLYDGGVGRGVLMWPMLKPFEPLMQRIALELTRRQSDDEPARLRDDAPGWLLMLAVQPANALDRLVLMHENDEDLPRGFEWAAAMRVATGMIWNALGPGLLLLIYWMMYQGILISPKVPITMTLALLWGLAEWPLAALLATSLDQVAGAGNKGYQSLYLYPIAQLPRLLPLGLAILLTLMGFPNLALLAWAAGIAWSGLLTAGLWEALYGWRGAALLGGSAMTVVFQLLTFVGVLVMRG